MRDALRLPCLMMLPLMPSWLSSWGLLAVVMVAVVLLLVLAVVTLCIG